MTKGFSRRTNLNTGLGIGFSDNLKMQDGIIANRGQVIVHELGVACTCRSGDLNEPVIGASGKFRCDKCENGILYRQPRQIMGLISNISYQKQLLAEGFATPGDCLLSVSPTLKSPPTDFDRITFTWPEPIGEGQVLVRGLHHKKTGSVEADEDLLNYAGASAVHVEDEDGNTYQQDVDFIFSGRRVKWLNGPTVNSRYTIKYEAYLSWIVFNSPQSRRDQDISLGSRILLRKSHIVDLRVPTETSAIDKAKFQPNVSV